MTFPPPRRIMLAIRYKVLRPALWNRVLLPRLRSAGDESVLRKYGIPETPEKVDAWLRARPSRFFFDPRNRKDFFLNVLTSVQSMDSIADEADLVLENKFQTLGSTLTDLGDPILWQRDFKSGKEWNLLPPQDLDILDLGQPSDVKVPWELSRFHQTWWLGKASWMTGNNEYARKFESLVSDWIDKNPVGLGVNWTVSMEVAIRACNWIAGYYFFQDASVISPGFWPRFVRSLLTHGLFIEHHLEYARVNGNHFLSNVVGLLFLGMFFSDTPKGRDWLRWSRQQLETQMAEQVYDDGVNHEKSTSYHRLVLELFSAAAILCRVNARPLSSLFMKRLERMYEFMEAYVRPDGSIPLVGDADDGRLFRFSMGQDVNDHRSLLSVGAVLFERDDFKNGSGGFSQESLWFFGGEGFERFQRLSASHEPRGSSAFPEGGFYCLQTDDLHVFVDAGDLGMRGRGGHGHNDTFSFELWARGEPLLVDSGTYAYTFDVEARQRFRSTQAHNTVMIDSTELADFNGLWSILEDRTRPEVLQWTSSPDHDTLEVRHHAYETLAQPVLHRRRFELDKKSLRLTVTDAFEGQGTHQIEAFFHLAPGANVTLVGEKSAKVHSGGIGWTLTTNAGTLSILETRFSRSYGLQESNQTVRLRLNPMLPAEVRTEIRLD